MKQYMDHARRSLRDKVFGPRLPHVYDHPLEALYHNGEAFHADIDQCVNIRAFHFSSQGWHPYLLALKHYQQHADREATLRYMVEIEKAIEADHALQAMHPELTGPAAIKTRPPLGLPRLVPWSSKDHNAALVRAHKHARQEGLLKPGQHARDGLDPEWISRNHLERLLGLRDSIARHGLDRKIAGEDIMVDVLQRGDQFRYVITRGHHRVAVMSLLGHRQVPVAFRYRVIIREQDVAHWPLVHRGVWDADNALQYFHHLFDFDIQQWARSKGIVQQPA